MYISDLKLDVYYINRWSSELHTVHHIPAPLMSIGAIDKDAFSGDFKKEKKERCIFWQISDKISLITTHKYSLTKRNFHLFQVINLEAVFIIW